MTTTQKISKGVKQIGVLTIALTLALVANFAYGEVWSDPAGAPPSMNTAAPINVSATSQTKDGFLTTVVSRSTGEMRSDNFCDYEAMNCVTPASLYSFMNTDLPVLESKGLLDEETSSASGINCRTRSNTQVMGAGNQRIMATCNLDEQLTGGGCNAERAETTMQGRPYHSPSSHPQYPLFTGHDPALEEEGYGCYANLGTEQRFASFAVCCS